MNKKGEVQNQIGAFIVLAIAAIVCLVLWQASVQNVGETTGSNILNVRNSTITMPAVGSYVELSGQELVTAFSVINRTGNSTVGLVPTTNYTITEGVNSDGVKGIRITSLGGLFTNVAVNVSYDAYPDGYIDDSGSRSIALLIPLLAALALAIFILAGSRVKELAE